MNNTLTVRPFIQHHRTLFTEKDGLPSRVITSAAVTAAGASYIGTDKGAALYEDGGFTRVITGKDKHITSLFTGNDGTVWAISGNNLYSISGKKAKLIFTYSSPLVSMAHDGEGNLWLLADDCVLIKNSATFTPYIRINRGGARAFAAFGQKRVFVATQTDILSLFGKRPRWGEIFSCNSGKPSDDVRDLCSDGKGHVWMATDKGVCIYDMHNRWVDAGQMASLKKGSIRRIVINSDTRYIGTDFGLYIETGASSDFFCADRWLPAGAVTAVAPAKDNSFVWVGTQNGLALISGGLTTLNAKADLYQQLTEELCVREGYVTKRILESADDIRSGYPQITDNDGLWTGLYLAVQSFRYAVTGQKQALELARRSCRALLKLFDITGISGFPARAYRRPGEDRYGDGDCEWHPAEDEKGELEWKGETSSDEIVGHFYGLTIYHKLCADKDEKRLITAALCGVADHILKNDYSLCDIDGKPTTWAHWSPDYLNRDDAWYWEHGINSLEILMILRTCHVLSGKAKYYTEYERLIQNEHYLLNAAQHKIDDCHVTHIDDNLGFLSTYVLLNFEDDAVIRQYILNALNHHWQTQRVERFPLWNIMYGALTGLSCDIENAVDSLEQYPVDLINRRVTNSAREDLEWSSGQERFDGGAQLTQPLKYGEKPFSDNDSNPFLADGGNERVLNAGTFFLHPYWMGRYYKLFNEDN